MNKALSEGHPPEKASSVDATPETSEKPKTSPIGRIVIGILLVVLAIEGFAFLRVTWAKSRITGELKRAEAEKFELTRDDVSKLLGGREPDETKEVGANVGDELYEVYYYSGILKRRVLCLRYGVEGQKGTQGSDRELIEVMSVKPEALLFEE
ncbi:MAG: hypothetical protein KDA52_01730 [Planctomycetaceae bacterium]|nr:hypothetical protein [Planctomycetaceae bacterium]